MAVSGGECVNLPGAVSSGAHQGEWESWQPGWWCGLHREKQEQDYSVF